MLGSDLIIRKLNHINGIIVELETEICWSWKAKSIDMFDSCSLISESPWKRLYMFGS